MRLMKTFCFMPDICEIGTLWIAFNEYKPLSKTKITFKIKNLPHSFLLLLYGAEFFMFVSEIFSYSGKIKYTYASVLWW